MTLGAADATAFERCVESGGVALFGADTVYGLAADPASHSAVARLYELKRRPANVPAAVMFFSVDAARPVLSGLEPRTHAAAAALLPGPVTLLVPNPAGLWPLACGPDPSVLGIRVPALPPSLHALAGIERPVLQSSANVHGGAEARRLADVDPSIRAGVEAALDAGELPGVASTVVDLTRLERDGSHTLLRAGGISGSAIAAAIGRAAELGDHSVEPVAESGSDSVPPS